MMWTFGPAGVYELAIALVFGLLYSLLLVLILRWVFRINTIVRLLKDIRDELKSVRQR